MKERFKNLVFLSKDVTTLFHITPRQLDYWVNTGLIKPSMTTMRGQGGVRFFTFHDLIQLRTMKALIDGGVSIQKIRKSIKYIREQLGVDYPLTARLITDRKTIWKIVTTNKDIIEAIDTVANQGQGVFLFNIGYLKKEVQEKVEQLKKIA